MLEKRKFQNCEIHWSPTGYKSVTEYVKVLQYSKGSVKYGTAKVRYGTVNIFRQRNQKYLRLSFFHRFYSCFYPYLFFNPQNILHTFFVGNQVWVRLFFQVAIKRRTFSKVSVPYGPENERSRGGYHAKTDFLRLIAGWTTGFWGSDRHFFGTILESSTTRWYQDFLQPDKMFLFNCCIYSLWSLVLLPVSITFDTWCWLVGVAIRLRPVESRGAAYMLYPRMWCTVLFHVASNVEWYMRRVRSSGGLQRALSCRTVILDERFWCWRGGFSNWWWMFCIV